mgnify:CR=1 FL=1
MSRRDFSHANNPDFDCAENVVLLPFGRRSYLEALVEKYDGDPVPLDETTAVSYTHLTLPTRCHRCRSRWAP